MSKPGRDTDASRARPSRHASSAPSPSNARVVTLRTRPPDAARARTRARAGPRSRANILSRRRSRRTRRRWETALGAPRAPRSRRPRGGRRRWCVRAGVRALGRSTRAREASHRDGARRTSKGTRSENLRERARDHTRSTRKATRGRPARVRACGGALASLSGVWEDARGWCAWGARNPPTPLSRVASPTNRVGFSRSRSKCRPFPPSSAAETRRVFCSGRSDLPRHRHGFVNRLLEIWFSLTREKKRFFGKPLATRILRIRRSALLAPAPSFLAFRIRARDESGPRAMCHNTHPSTS